MNLLLRELEKAHVEWETEMPLAPRSTFRIGGRAELALFPKSRAGLIEALRLVSLTGMPMTVIGNGSNVVFPDAGMRGAVIFTSKYRQIDIDGEIITAAAGTPLSHISNLARDLSLSGSEFCYGIPGTLGGAVFMNAGAFGGCMEQICLSSDYFDCNTGEVCTLTGAEHCFGERTSIYAYHPRWVILSATLGLKRGNAEKMDEDMKSFLERRRATQPIDLPSAGSVFKRPVGHYAGKLIEDCGLKGTRIGGAEVSFKHAGFIVNQGGATADDVKALTELIRDTVWQKTGVMLECEIRFL